MPGVEQRLDLTPRPTSAAEARRFVAKALRDLDPRVREVSVLLTSELVTNALLYAQGRITVRVRREDDVARVIVRDDSLHPAEPKQVQPEATSGRGLALVDKLSSSWGVDLDDDGKEVWFEVPGA